MSVINKMLRDLDARRRPAPPGGVDLPGAPLPSRAEPRRSDSKRLLALVAVAAALAGWWWVDQQQAPPPGPRVLVEAGPESPAPAAATAPADSGGEQASAPPLAEAGPAPEAVAEAPAPGEAAGETVASPAPDTPVPGSPAADIAATGSPTPDIGVTWTSPRVTDMTQPGGDASAAAPADPSAGLAVTVVDAAVPPPDAPAAPAEAGGGVAPEVSAPTADSPAKARASVAPPGPQSPSAEASSPPAFPGAPSEPRSATAKREPRLSPAQQADRHYAEALRLMSLGVPEEAVARLRMALEANPALAPARQALAGLLAREGRLEPAMTLLAEGLNLAPGEPTLSMLLARLQVERGGVNEAIATLQRGLPAAGDDAEYRAFLAALAQRVGNHGEAIAHYAVALRQQPANGTWLAGLGISLEATGRTPEAAEAFLRARNSGTLPTGLRQYVYERSARLQQR